MARPRRTLIEQFVDCYADMEPEERQLAKAALTGADRVLSRNGKTAKVPEQSQVAFAELGETLAEGTE